jgi:CheY-like chemotaxis protein
MKKPINRKEPSYKYQSVMLVDDNELDNFINQKVIESCFFSKTIYVNTNGISALEFFKNIMTAEKSLKSIIPRVIFIDINMPLMDGFQFIDEFMKFPQNIKDRTNLVILTSSISPRDKEIVSRYGDKVSFINKPLNEESLFNI